MTDDSATEHPDIEASEAPTVGPLLDFEKAAELEALDRQKAIPGGEPPCPACGTKMVRHVERHPAPKGGGSPFRVRLVCPSADCGSWTVYDW